MECAAKMSGLLCQACDINQKFNNYFYKCLPLNWNRKYLEWSHQGNFQKLLPYYFVNGFLNCIVSSSILTFLLPLMILRPELFQIEQVIGITIYGGSVIPLTFLVDFLMFRYGAELAAVANWAGTTKSSYRIPPHFTCKANVFPAIMAELSKIARGIRPVDWYGLAGIACFLAETAMSFFIPTVFVYGKSDIYSVFLQTLSNPSILGRPFAPNPDRMMIRALCYLIAIPAAITVFIAIKNLVLVGLCQFQFYREVLQYMVRARVSKFRLQLYREVQVAFRMLHTVSKIGLGVYLGVAFYLLLLCMNVVLFGWKYLPWNIYAAMPGSIVVLGAALNLLFSCGCGIYEKSGNVLQVWRKQLISSSGGGWRAKREIKMVLRSLKPLSLPVGEVGIMDKEIKGNYLSTFLNSFVSTSFAARDFLK